MLIADMQKNGKLFAAILTPKHRRHYSYYRGVDMKRKRIHAFVYIIRIRQYFSR